ncbi:MAG: hypothetical protein U9O54_06390 [Chloroflexota bacterium]|nr:hypothetical protein [Chloroflexota bacterium]
MDTFFNFIAQTLLGELLIVIIGVFLTHFMRLTWDRWRYGGWTVGIIRGEKRILEEEIPPSKVKEILNDPISLRIYLKGLVSTYDWLRCDLLIEGKQNGLFSEDREKRRFMVDLDKNPPPANDQRRPTH